MRALRRAAAVVEASALVLFVYLPLCIMLAPLIIAELSISRQSQDVQAAPA